jgi:hypothetical protein
MGTMLRWAALSVTLSMVSCTWGIVRMDDMDHSALGAGTVIYEDCAGATMETSIREHGIYAFNPFSPDSTAAIPENFVREGLMLISVRYDIPGHHSFLWPAAMVEHQYDEACQVRYNGADRMLPCKRHDLTVPITLFESFSSAESDFRSECERRGFAPREAWARRAYG